VTGRCDPAALDALPRRERQVLAALYALGEATAENVRRTLDDPPGSSAVRTLLARLEIKGFAAHRVVGQRFVYRATAPKAAAARAALRRVVDTMFGGSPTAAAAALAELAEAESRRRP
jgi:predicted transcriptional regulator